MAKALLSLGLTSFIFPGPSLSAVWSELSTNQTWLFPCPSHFHLMLLFTLFSSISHSTVLPLTTPQDPSVCGSTPPYVTHLLSSCVWQRLQEVRRSLLWEMRAWNLWERQSGVYLGTHNSRQKDGRTLQDE